MSSQSNSAKKRGVARDWTTVKECSSKEEVDDWIAENGGNWIHAYDKSPIKFADQVYHCDHSARNRPGIYDCKAGMRVRYSKDLSVASKAFIQTTGQHDHKMLEDKGLSSPVKRSIEEKDEAFGGMTASRILRKLQRKVGHALERV